MEEEKRRLEEELRALEKARVESMLLDEGREANDTMAKHNSIELGPREELADGNDEALESVDGERTSVGEISISSVTIHKEGDADHAEVEDGERARGGESKVSLVLGDDVHNELPTSCSSTTGGKLLGVHSICLKTFECNYIYKCVSICVYECVNKLTNI